MIRTGFRGFQCSIPMTEVNQHVPELSEKPEDVPLSGPLNPLLSVVV